MAACVSSAGAKQIITGLLSPTQLPGLQVWLDGADPLGTGTAPANGTVISTWADKSGNSRNSTGFSSPTYSSASRSVIFNGSSQYFTVPYAGTHPTETCFVIINITDPTTTSEIIMGNAAGARDLLTYQNLIQLFTSQGSSIVTGALPSAGVQTLLGYSYSSSSSSLYKNGTLTGSGGGFTAPAETLLFLGTNYLSIAGRALTGTISEVLIYNQFLSTVQRQAVEGYLAWKWNLMSSLPAGHPYIVTAAVPTSISTSFFPTYMPGIQLWLDGSDPLGTGTAPANGTTISTWADKSGNARNATSVGSPVFNTSSNAIVLNGTSQGFSFTYSGVHPTETAFMVVNMTTPNSFAVFINNTTSYARQFYDYFTALTLGQANIGTNATNSNVPTAGSNTLLGYNLNSTNSFLYFNGVSGPTGTGFGSLPSESTVYIGYSGSGQYLAGTISEVIIYNQVLSTPQRQVVEGYLAWKWGIQTALTSNHPFRYVTPTSLSIGGLTDFSYNKSYLPGLTAWYDAADPLGTGFQPANGTTISTWADKAGESLNPMIATGSPTYTTGSQNGLPGITVSGNSGTTITTFFQTQIAPGTFLAELDAFVVYKNTSSVTFNTLITRNTLGNNYGNPLDLVNQNYVAGLSNATFNTSSYNVYNTATSIFNINISQNTTASSKMTGYTNGTAMTFSLSGGSSTWTPSDIGNILTLGSRGDRLTGFNGLFYEVMVFNFPLTTGGRHYVEGYLAWKWGLQASLPTTHPYYLAAPNIYTLPFQPTQIFGLNIWLDGADPLNTGALPANGATITTWFDKSPNLYSGVSAGSASPTYILASRSIATTNSTYFSLPYGGTHPSETAFFVYNITTPSSGVQSFVTGFGVNGTRAFLTYINNIYFQTFNIQNYAYTTSSNVPAGVNGIYGYSYNSSNAFVYQNGTVGSYSASGMSAISDSTTTVAGIVGSVSEIILFNTVLTTVERQVVEGYLAWKWGTQASLPATHPYKTVQPSSLTFVPSYTNTSNIAANADSYLPLMSNTFDIGNTPQLVGSNGTLSFSNVLGKNCIYINNNTANFVSLPMANNNVFTIAFWFNYTSTSYFTAASYTTAAGALAIQFDLVAAGSNTAYTALPNQWTISPSSSNLGVNTWNFMTLTINQNTYVGNLYMNGVLAISATGSGAFPSSPNLMVLGKSGDQTVAGGTRSYQGFLQNFMYFNTVLTAAQVASIYEQTALDLAIASQPTSLSLTFSTPNLTFSWVAGTNTTSYVVSFYGIATNTTVGGTLLATYNTTSTSQTYAPSGNAFVYATVTPTNSGFLGTSATSSAVSLLPSAATGVTMGSFAAQQTTISASWTAGAGATSYTVNFLSNAANSTSGGTVWQTFTGVTGTSQTSSSTLISGSNGTYYYATVTSVNAAGSSAAATSSGNIQYYIPTWISGSLVWLDANDSSTYTLSGSTLASPGWKDKVANRYFLPNNGGASNATTGTASPVLSNVSGYNSFFFNNPSASQTAASVGVQTNVTTTPLTIPSENITIITVAQDQATNTNAQYRCLLNFGTNSIATRPNMVIFYQTTSIESFAVLQDYNGSSWGRAVNLNRAVSYAKELRVATISPTSTVLYVNGTATNTNLTVYNSPYTNIPINQLGFAVNGNGSRCWGGYIYEAMIFNNPLSTTYRQMAEGYLAWKWGTVASLPAGHPYISASP